MLRDGARNRCQSVYLGMPKADACQVLATPHLSLSLAQFNYGMHVVTQHLKCPELVG